MQLQLTEENSLLYPNVAATLSPATPSISGTKRGIVPKRRFQKGTFVKRGNNWVGMWRVDALQLDGTIKREQRSKTFVGLSERAARFALQPILDAVNATSQATPPVPKTSDTESKAVREWREHAAVTLKPNTKSSAESYRLLMSRLEQSASSWLLLACASAMHSQSEERTWILTGN